jgi:adenylate cyclase
MKPWLIKKLSRAAAVSLTVFIIVSGLHLAGAFTRLESISYDLMVRVLRAEKEAHPDIAIIMIDEASLKAMNPLVGRWPWPRSVFADLLEFLSMGSPGGVALDIFFTENERHPGQGPSAGDLRLAGATRSNGTVYHAVELFHDREDEVNRNLLGRDLPGEFRERFALMNITAGRSPGQETQNNNFTIPLKELYLASGGIGVVEFESDPDGVHRRTRPLRKYRGEHFPVMGIAPLLEILKIKDITLTESSLDLDGISMPLHRDGTCIINMYGKFNTYSISGVLASIQKIRSGDVQGLMVEPGEFEGKIVFIGSSAAGLRDLKATPVSNRTPGVMLHASLASNVLLEDFLAPAGPWLTAALILALSLSAALPVLLSGRLLARALVPLIFAASFYALALYGFGRGMLLETVPPLAASALGFTASFVYLALTEGREKRKVRKMLGQYVSPHVLVELMDRREEVLRAEVGSREHVTLLFSDIRDFTGISESMPPDRIVHMLNRYFSEWTDVIFKHDGTVDKFVGDAVMAVWGAPLRTGDHAVKAVRAACEMLGRLADINAALGAEGYPPVRIGIGINSGEAIIGNIGSERKLDYTAIGDAVNLASRLEALTKQYGCDILISESTFNLLSEEFACKFVDRVKVRGKETPACVYKVEKGGEP